MRPRRLPADLGKVAAVALCQETVSTKYSVFSTGGGGGNINLLNAPTCLSQRCCRDAEGLRSSHRAFSPSSSLAEVRGEENKRTEERGREAPLREVRARCENKMRSVTPVGLAAKRGDEGREGGKVKILKR